MDIVLARQLRADLSFDLHLTSACSDRGMLSDSLQTALLLAQFIALVLPWARAAQGTTGVRASLLIAESFERTCLGSVIPANNDFFNTGKSCASGKDAFMQRGYAIQSDPTFREVLLANDSHVYLTRLANWSEAGDQDAKEVFLFVLNHELASCDSISL
ncbi:MAG: hypothetical protein LAO20_10370 [Acidobacteriia bacterium]|nr:hypothetical protein [Terriglobia bacterium]